MKNPLLARYGKPRHGQRSERRVAKKLGSRPNPGSGALPGAKGDVTRPKFLIELKATGKESYRIEKKVLDKIKKEALDKNRVPALGVSFVTESGEARENGDWIALPLWFFRAQGW